jgi:trehalose-phosphatase
MCSFRPERVNFIVCHKSRSNDKFYWERNSARTFDRSNMTQNLPNHDLPVAEVAPALERLHEIVARQVRRLAIFLDYDGTLTPIVAQPENAVLSDSTRQIVRTLANHMPVAILTGRNLDDIRRRVGIDEIIYAGSHGFDIAGPRGLRKEVATEFLPILEAAEKELGEKLTSIPGVLLDRKRFSIAAHYRQADESGVGKFKQAVDEIAARHRELRRIAGKKVYELRPDIDWDKGRAVIWLLEALGLARSKTLPLYIGDDLTDEDAFRAIRRYGVGIVVSDQPRWTAARYALKNPAEVERFLHELVARLPG